MAGDGDEAVLAGEQQEGVDEDEQVVQHVREAREVHTWNQILKSKHFMNAVVANRQYEGKYLYHIAKAIMIQTKSKHSCF